MSTPHLPAELLDHVVDLLHETVPTLRNCCLVSKSLVPRARTYLFANVTFLTERQLRSWKENFPDPSTSPAHYTKTLVISFPYVFTAADARAGSWISGFSHVTQLVLGSTVAYANRLAISLVPLHGFSPALKSLHVSFTGLPSLRIFNLILSFPLLDDLTVATYGTPINTVPDGWVTIAQPSSPPTFSGTLRLFLKVGMGTITRQLLSLPGGIHFRKLDLIWSHEEDPSSASALVGRCSRTLEYLNITCNTLDRPRLVFVDLSKATRLKSVVFMCRSLNAKQVLTTLQTITPNHQNLQITLYVPDVHYDPAPNRTNSASVRLAIGGAIHEQWLELDRLLVQLWRLHSIRTMALYYPGKGGNDQNSSVYGLLPEMARGGVADLVRRSW